MDLLVSSVDNPLELFVNHGGNFRNWIAIRLKGEFPNLDAIGAVVTVTSGGYETTQDVMAGSALKSQHDLTLLFGLDQNTVADLVRVLWPGGATKTYANLPSGQSYVLARD